jgi:spore coat protein H
MLALLVGACGAGEEGTGPGPGPISWTDVVTDGAQDATLDGSPPVDGDPLDTAGPGSFGIPVMHIVGSAAELTRIHERFNEELTIEVDLSYGGRSWTGVRLELHGGFARSVPKKSYRLVFPDDDQLEGDLFGEGKSGTYRRLVLQASWIDRTFIRSKLTMDLIRALDGLAPRVGYVILEMNGEWLGLYQAIERIDRPFLGRAKLDKGGNLYKAENHWANWQAKADPLAGYDIQEGADNAHDDLGELLDALTHTPLTDADFEAEVEPRLDLGDFMTFQMVHTLAMNEDTFTKNYYLYHDVEAEPGKKKDRFRLISWDADATWGNSWDGTVLEPTKVAWHGTDAFSPRLFAVASYGNSYGEDYLEALSDALSPAVIALRVAAIASQIAGAAQADLERWEHDSGFQQELDRLLAATTARVSHMTSVLEELSPSL